MMDTNTPATLAALAFIRFQWTNIQVDILKHNARNKLPLESLSLHCSGLQRLQFNNGPLKYNYAE